MDIVYRYQNNLYVNLTNRCASACTFCIKQKWEWKYRSYDLKLDHEPTADEVIAAIGDPTQCEAIVFCGYGEPLIRYDVLIEVARKVKAAGGTIRINTSGLANLFHKRNIVPELIDVVDSISISLNASSPEEYEAIHKPAYGLESFEGIFSFASECKKIIPDVVLTCVELPGLEVKKCVEVIEERGFTARIRPYLEEYETS